MVAPAMVLIGWLTNSSGTGLLGEMEKGLELALNRPAAAFSTQVPVTVSEQGAEDDLAHGVRGEQACPRAAWPKVVAMLTAALAPDWRTDRWPPRSAHRAWCPAVVFRRLRQEDQLRTAPAEDRERV